jgi:hypothetical protein
MDLLVSIALVVVFAAVLIAVCIRDDDDGPDDFWEDE